MANPQKENGYTPIAHEIIEALANSKYRLSGEEWCVLMVIFRKTYGWDKKTDDISITQFHEMTGIVKPNIVRSIKKLLSKKIIVVIKKDNKMFSTYGFNKNYDDWELLSKKITLSKKIKDVINNDNSCYQKREQLLSKKIPTIDNTNKLITEDPPVAEPLNYDKWKENLKTNPNKIGVLGECFKQTHTSAPPEDLNGSLFGRMGSLVRISGNDYGRVLQIIWQTAAQGIEGSHLNYIQGILRSHKVKDETRSVTKYPQTTKAPWE